MHRHPALRPAIGTGLLLTVPLVMSILDRDKPPGDGWDWEPFDFLVMGALLFGAGLAYELVARRLHKPAHRLMLGLAILFAVFVVWVELAVDGVSQLLHWAFG